MRIKERIKMYFSGDSLAVLVICGVTIFLFGMFDSLFNERYRIVTNGEIFRIQRMVSCGLFSGGVGGDFQTKEQAEKQIRVWTSRNKEWKVAE